MLIYLNVPYQEKDEVRSLGAKWDPKVKKWFADTRRENYVKFSKWILRDTDDAIIAIENIYLIEGEQKCWKCGDPTTVIGFGISEFVHIFGEPGKAEYEIIEACVNVPDELHLAWASDEKDIPPKLLKYLKENYYVKTLYSKVLNRNCFANYCSCCGALQGNHFLFEEPDSPLSSCVQGDELVERMSKLKIKEIPIEPDLLIDWELGFCSNDYAYFKYGHLEELILSSDPQNEYVSYDELYDIY